MSEEAKKGISLGVAAVVFVICFIKLFLKGKSKNQRFIEKAEAGGHYTTGNAVETKRYRGDIGARTQRNRCDRLKVTYEYSVNGVSYKKKRMFQSPGCISIHYPRTITVYYDPKNPSKAICPGEASQEAQKEGACIMTIAYSGLAIFVVINLLNFLF